MVWVVNMDVFWKLGDELERDEREWKMQMRVVIIHDNVRIIIHRYTPLFNECIH